MRFIWTLSKTVIPSDNVVPLGRYMFGKAREPILGPKPWSPRLGQLSKSRRLYTGSMTGTRKVDLA